MQKNVLGTVLRPCSLKPLTGFFRNGCCETDEEDQGEHTACVEVTDEFLEFSRAQGNDLITPEPRFQFPGLKAGDRWCVCAARWVQAYRAGYPAKIVLEASHESLLDHVTLEELKKFAVPLNHQG
jgi:uncharacterized protein (DUF2237 family)